MPRNATWNPRSSGRGGCQEKFEKDVPMNGAVEVA
jgi:hypothetical protein